MDKTLFDMLMKKYRVAMNGWTLLSLELLGNKVVGIGTYSTEDFYKTTEEAPTTLVDADDRIDTLNKYFKSKEVL